MLETALSGLFPHERVLSATNVFLFTRTFWGLGRETFMASEGTGKRIEEDFPMLTFVECRAR